MVWRIEDNLRGRTTARPPLVDGHGLCRRPFWLALGGVLEALGRVLEVLESVLEASWLLLEALGGVQEAMLSQDGIKKVQERETFEKSRKNETF